MRVTFGTEGWRGIIAEEFTTERLRMVTQAVAEHVLSLSTPTSSPTLAVGYDTRFLSGRFARTVCEVLAGNGIAAVVSGTTVPTCAVSRYVVRHRLAAGVMITASHNPGAYNGFKLKEAYGGSATTETVASVERRLGRHPVKRVPFDDARRNRSIREADFLGPYLEGIRRFLDLRAIRRAPLRIVVDSMHGAGGTIIEELLRGGRCRVETLRAAPDPLFGGQAPEPIASHLTGLSRHVRRRRAHVGIANDGDADRLGIVSPNGTWLNPGQVMCMLLLHLVHARGSRGAVVKTVSNTMMINRLTDALGLKLIEVPVGFKHIAKLMLEQDVLIGGEESGGIGMRGYLPERDGIVNGLMLAEAMAARKQTPAAMLRDLERRYGRWAYGRRDLTLRLEQVQRLFRRLEEAPPGSMGGVRVTGVNRLDGVKLIGRDESWMLFRRSGTEPIVRLYAETPSPRRLAALLSLGMRLATRS
ncbi:MAG TPA: phosphoglucomutase/phosphomannomutase family protein [bacterium]